MTGQPPSLQTVSGLEVSIGVVGNLCRIYDIALPHSPKDFRPRLDEIDDSLRYSLFKPQGSVLRMSAEDFD